MLTSVVLKHSASILFSIIERMKRFITTRALQKDSERVRNPTEYTAYAKREILKICYMMEPSANFRRPAMLKDKFMNCWDSTNLCV